MNLTLKIFKVCFFALFFSTIAFSQELVKSIPLELKKNRDVFQIINNENAGLTLFLSDKNTVKAIKLKDDMTVLDSMSVARPAKEYSDMIGYNGIENPRLFWSSSNRKKITSQVYNFETRKSSSKEYLLSLENERFLQNFSEKGKFYILTTLKSTNILKFYIFDIEGNLEEKTVDFATPFFTSDNKQVSLNAVLGENLLPFEGPFHLEKINSETPTSLAESAKKRKCYIINNTLFITLDNSYIQTHLITVKLDNFEAKTTVFKQPFVQSLNDFGPNSNSFLIDNSIYQMKVSSSNLHLQIKNLEGKLLNEHFINDEGPITFNNTPVLQENGEFGNNRILEKSSQFLRKLRNLNAGISSYKSGANYIITLGSVSEVRENAMAGMFGAAGFLLNYAISNPTYNSFNSYAHRKVIYTNCLFDPQGNHVTGSLNPVAFDKIRKFLDDEKNATSHTLFKYENSYYLGFYDTREKAYILRKFED